MKTRHQAQEAAAEGFLDKIEQIAAQSRQGQRKVSSSQTQHPSGKLLYEYAAGNLEREHASQIRRHLMRCAACNFATLAIMRLTSGEIVAHPIFDDLQAFIQNWTEKVKGSLDAATRVTALWQPQWAGQLTTAADLPAQEHLFALDEGAIRLSCIWQPQHRKKPAFIELTWNADLKVRSDLSALFIRLEDPQHAQVEVPLGNDLRGDKIITSGELGFDPSRERWAIALILHNNGA
ncbi:hypothetical protein U27_04155 [Candidatus Vecturithrix granuli]|uniref:Putative zinc-finger domain-containing protein n=1 Tax=Vecturithrix granuli TaxID=1499967 RepID=A0A081BXY5_VECG1|nr:hypothetical protein U27_04155 [Candidatus Vecturithrix granuli]